MKWFLYILKIDEVDSWAYKQLLIIFKLFNYKRNEFEISQCLVRVIFSIFFYLINDQSSNETIVTTINYKQNTMIFRKTN